MHYGRVVLAYSCGLGLKASACVYGTKPMFPQSSAAVQQWEGIIDMFTCY